MQRVSCFFIEFDAASSRTFLFLECENNDLNDTHNRTSESSPEGVHLKISAEWLSAFHYGQGSMLPYSPLKRHAQ